MGYYGDTIRIKSEKRHIDETAKVIPFGTGSYWVDEDDYSVVDEYGWSPGYHGRRNFLSYNYVFKHDDQWYFMYFSYEDHNKYESDIESAIRQKMGFYPDEVYYWNEKYWEE